MLKYSRDDESEADALAVQNLRGAGFDPNGLASFLSKLADMKGRNPTKLETLLSTHPPTQERIRNAEAAARKLPPPAAQRSEARFQAMKRSLNR